MSESTEAVATAKNNDEIVVTEKESRERINTEPGFYKKVLDGKVRVVSEEEKAAMQTEKPAEAAGAEPQPAKTETAKETVKEKETPEKDEIINAQLKKSQLGKYKNLNERLKAADELEPYVKFQKSRIRELEDAISGGEQTKAELANAKKEIEELKKSVVETQKQQNAVINKGTVPDIKVPDFVLDLKEDDDIFNTDTQKKVIDHIRNLTDVNKKQAQAYADLVAQAKVMQARIEEIDKGVKDSASKQEERIKSETDRMVAENIYNEAATLQSGHEELKTKAHIKELDKEYVEFTEDLYRVAKANTPKEKVEIIDRYFNDSSEAGDNLRKLCETNGINPPEEVDKYLTIRNILQISKRTQEIGDDGKPRPLDKEKAYALYLTESGGLNKRVADEMARAGSRAAAARNANAQNAEVVGSDANAVAPQEEAELIKAADKILKENTFKEIKNDPTKKKTVDEFYVKSGIPAIDWSKF
jgi:hypothetical protein